MLFLDDIMDCMVLIGHLEFFLGSRSGQDLLLLQEATEHARVVYFHILITLPAELGQTNLTREDMLCYSWTI